MYRQGVDEAAVFMKKSQPQVRPLLQQLITERRGLRTLVQAVSIDEPAIQKERDRKLDKFLDRIANGVCPPCALASNSS